MRKPAALFGFRALPCLALLIGAGCKSEHQITLAPVEFKPIHLTMDVNIKIQRELEEFFDFEQTFGPDTEGNQ